MNRSLYHICCIRLEPVVIMICVASMDVSRGGKSTFSTTFDGGLLPRSCNARVGRCTRITNIATRFTMTAHLHPSRTSSSNSGNGNRLLLLVRPCGACDVAPCFSVLLFSLSSSLSRYNFPARSPMCLSRCMRQHIGWTCCKRKSPILTACLVVDAVVALRLDHGIC